MVGSILLSYTGVVRLPIDVTSLSTSEKLDLLHELWESLPKRVSSPTLDRSVKRMLDERLADLAKNPGSSVPWSEVRTRVFGQKSRR